MTWARPPAGTFRRAHLRCAPRAERQRKTHLLVVMEHTLRRHKGATLGCSGRGPSVPSTIFLNQRLNRGVKTFVLGSYSEIRDGFFQAQIQTTGGRILGGENPRQRGSFEDPKGAGFPLAGIRRGSSFFNLSSKTILPGCCSETEEIVLGNPDPPRPEMPLWNDLKHTLHFVGITVCDAILRPIDVPEVGEFISEIRKVHVRDCQWLSWAGWGQCTASCGGGYKFRARQRSVQKLSPGAAPCVGDPNIRREIRC